MSTLYELRPLTFGELLDRAFTLLRRHFALFAGIALVAQVVPELATRGLQTFLRGSLHAAGRPSTATAVAISAVGVAILFLSYAASVLAQAATARAMAALMRGEPVTVREAYARLRGCGARLAGLTLAGALGLFAGFVLCLVPGVVAAAHWCVATPALVEEDLRPLAALGRSSALARGHLGRALLFGLLVGALFCAVAGMLMVPRWALTAARGGHAAHGPVLGAITYLASMLADVLLTTLAAVLACVFYYDLRIRKEGYDVEQLLRRLDAAGPPPAPPAG